jgi:formamidopyrimidine-DNA glycosylase
MPELPDVTIYLEHLKRRVLGRRLERIRLGSPFVLRSVDPPLSALNGKQVVGLRRLGKRLVFALEDDGVSAVCRRKSFLYRRPEEVPPPPTLDSQLFLVLHLMIAGRLQWKAPGARIPGRIGLAALDFDGGTLILTEASGKKRAWLRLVRGEEALAALDPGGIEPLEASLEAFSAELRRERHSLKRALTDPRLFSGIGNAYSDEILHRARLSPTQMSLILDAEEVARLLAATQETLREWVDRLRRETGDDFPVKVTAFRPEMAVHGRYGEPCPRCGAKVQRITYADNETNYCAACQTGGKLLADRSLSKLLKSDWPRTLEEMEEWKKESREVVGRARGPGSTGVVGRARGPGSTARGET